MATKTLPDTQTFALPDGKPIAPELIEADLRSRLTKCEEALGDAIWQLARLYSFVGRHEDATACVERCLAGARDPAKQAAGCLGLGQLLEQQERYAEAEAMYAHGLEIPTAAAESALRDEICGTGRDLRDPAVSAVSR
jgi:tetratricopeptide (TPR) repeat protein